MSAQTGELIVAVCAIGGVLGGMLRYVVRLAVTVDRAAQSGAQTVEALRAHAQDSARIAEAHTAQLGEHAVRLAVVESKLP